MINKLFITKDESKAWEFKILPKKMTHQIDIKDCVIEFNPQPNNKGEVIICIPQPDRFLARYAVELFFAFFCDSENLPPLGLVNPNSFYWDIDDAYIKFFDSPRTRELANPANLFIGYCSNYVGQPPWIPYKLSDFDIEGTNTQATPETFKNEPLDSTVRKIRYITIEDTLGRITKFEIGG